MPGIGSVGLFVTLMDACNLDCSFCKFPGRDEFRNGNKLDFDRFINAIKQAKNDSPIPLGAVCYCGSGEPLLYDRIGDVVFQTKRYVPQVSVVSNGLALDEDISRDLIKAGLNHIVISITGNSEYVYSLFQGSGEKTKNVSQQFDNVRRNIERFVQIRNDMYAETQVGISYILSEKSRDDYFGALNHWREIGVDYVDTRILSTGFHLSVEDFEDDIAKNAKWWWESCCTCFGKVMNVFTDGRISFCNCAYREETILGNLYEKSLGEILRTDRFRELYRCFTEDYQNIPSYCKTCDLRRARPILA